MPQRPGHHEMRLFLSSQGASTNVGRQKGFHPLNSAALNGHARVVEALASSVPAGLHSGEQRGGTGHAEVVKVLAFRRDPA